MHYLNKIFLTTKEKLLFSAYLPGCPFGPLFPFIPLGPCGPGAPSGPGLPLIK